MHALCSGGGADRARHRARKRRKTAASKDRLRTTRRHRPEVQKYAEIWVSALLSPAHRVAPAVRLPSRRNSPFADKGETRVVSTATWTLPHRDKPFAMTSVRRSSCREGTKLRSGTKTLVAPASRQTRAAARPSGAPLARRTPERGHAARWSPNSSWRRRQRQCARSQKCVEARWHFLILAAPPHSTPVASCDCEGELFQKA